MKRKSTDHIKEARYSLCGYDSNNCRWNLSQLLERRVWKSPKRRKNRKTHIHIRERNERMNCQMSPSMREDENPYQTYCHTTQLSSSTSCYRRTRARVCVCELIHSSSWIHSQTSTFVYNCSLVCSFTFAILAWQLEKWISGSERNEQLLNVRGGQKSVSVCMVRVVDMTICFSLHHWYERLNCDNICYYCCSIWLRCSTRIKWIVFQFNHDSEILETINHTQQAKWILLNCYDQKYITTLNFQFKKLFFLWKWSEPFIWGISIN